MTSKTDIFQRDPSRKPSVLEGWSRRFAKWTSATALPRLTAGLVLATVLVSASPASATDWIIDAQLIGVDTSFMPVRECVLPNQVLRVHSRWISMSGPESPWGPWWGSPANIRVTTDANGEFSHRKLMLNPNLTRDIEIQRHESVWPNAWRTIATIGDVNGISPDFITGFDDRGFDLGEIRIPANCATVMTSAGDNGGRKGGKEDKADKGDKESFSDRLPVIEAMPCGLGPFGDRGIDFVLASVTVRHRDLLPTSPYQVTWEAVVRNDGTSSYSGTESCLAEVNVTFTRTDPNDGGTDERTYCQAGGNCDVAGPLAPAASAIVVEEGNLWSNSGGADRVEVFFEVDPHGAVLESDESNNTAIGCYEPATETFQLGPCQ